jgi:hypothetical protein
VAVCTLALAVASCGGSTTPSAQPTLSNSSPTTTPLPRVSAGASGQDGGLPAPTLSEAADINAALNDPSKVDVGVVSLLANLGVGIDAVDGTPLRPGSGALSDLRLSEPEVRGLIEMGTADAQAIMNGGTPWTLANLHDGLSSLIAGLTLDETIGAYVTAYRAAPGDFVREVLNGHPLLPTTAFTRVQLWLLLVDGVLGRHGGSAAGPRGATTVAFRPVAAGPIATVALPPITLQVPLFDLRDIGLLVSHLMTVAYAVPMEFTITPTAAHEGHGGPGPDVAIDLRFQLVGSQLVSPHSGLPLLVPTTTSLAGVPIIFRSPDTSVLAAHGTFPSQLGVPIMTDFSGIAHMGYQLREEPAGGTGQLENASAMITAVADLQLVLASRYVIVNGGLVSFALGERVIPSVLFLEWHEDQPTPAPGDQAGIYEITLTGPKEGAGRYVGRADSICAATVSAGRQFWTMTGQPHDSGATLFDLQQDASGGATISVSTDSQTELGPWYATSKYPGQTASITASGSGQNILVQGHGTFTDSESRLFTIDIAATCALVV